MALNDGKMDTMPLGTSVYMLGVDASGKPVLDSSVTALKTLLGAQIIGLETPIAGTNISSPSTFVQNEAAAADSYIEGFSFYAAVAGSITFGIFTKSSNTFTRTASKTVTAEVGLNAFSWGATVLEGQYLGVTVATTGTVTYNSGTDAKGWFSGTLVAEAFTDAAASTGAPISYRFDLRPLATQLGGRFAGKRIAFFGDSLTADDPWPGELCAYLGATLAGNYAVGGTYFKNGFIDQFDSGTFDDVDIALFTGCTNDYHNAVTLGTSADTSATASFHGYVKNVIETALGYKPELTLLFAGSPQRTMPPAVGGGPTLLEYVDALKEEAGLYGCPFKDLYRESGLNALNMSTYTADGLHPSEGSGQTKALLNPLKAFFDGVAPA